MSKSWLAYGSNTAMGKSNTWKALQFRVEKRNRNQRLATEARQNPIRNKEKKIIGTMGSYLNK